MQRAPGAPHEQDFTAPLSASQLVARYSGGHRYSRSAHATGGLLWWLAIRRSRRLHLVHWTGLARPRVIERSRPTQHYWPLLAASQSEHAKEHTLAPARSVVQLEVAFIRIEWLRARSFNLSVRINEFAKADSRSSFATFSATNGCGCGDLPQAIWYRARGSSWDCVPTSVTEAFHRVDVTSAPPRKPH